MFDKIAGRVLIPVGVVVTGFLVVCFALLYSAIKEVVLRDSISQANNLAGVVLKSTRFAMLKSDRDTNDAIIRNIGEQKGVQHVRIFNKKGAISFSSKPGEVGQQVDKKAEGCVICHEGKEPLTTLGPMEKARTYKNSQGMVVTAITAPIYNDPECANAACHFHPAEQKVLGTLDIGLSQQTTLESLASIRGEMFLFAVLSLFLTMAGVITVLKMIVLAPMQKLLDYTEVSQQQLDLPHPDDLPYELDKIAKSYYLIKERLDRLHDESGNPPQR
jgi:hypothetical protein